ncbi:MAG: hypothetical protein PHU71_02475 [Candidatus Gracilibacteria bacterium]|nr:hypothetical protein [Candidatus Gracilibacteria bacterium]
MFSNRTLIISVNTLISWILKIVMIVVLIVEIFDGNYILVANTSLALILTFTPAIVNRSFSTNLPWVVDFFVTLSLFLHVAGSSFDLYNNDTGKVPFILFLWWDRVAHFMGTATIAMLAFMVVYTLHFVGKIRMTIPMIGLFTFTTALAIGALWEIAEFFNDKLFGTKSLGDVVDTIEDLIFDSVAGALIAIFGMFYVAKQTGRIIPALVHPWVKVFAPGFEKLYNAERNLKRRVKNYRAKRKLAKSLKQRTKNANGDYPFSYPTGTLRFFLWDGDCFIFIEQDPDQENGR